MKHIIKIFSVLVICVSMPAIVHAAAMTREERIDKCLAAVNELTNAFQDELKNLITEDTLARTEADGGEAGLRNLVKSIHIPITSIFSQKIKDIDGCQNAINDLQSRSKLKLHLFGNKKYAYYINSNELNKYRRVKYYIWLSWNNTYKPGTIIKKQDL